MRTMMEYVNNLISLRIEITREIDEFIELDKELSRRELGYDPEVEYFYTPLYPKTLKEKKDEELFMYAYYDINAYNDRGVCDYEEAELEVERQIDDLAANGIRIYRDIMDSLENGYFMHLSSSMRKEGYKEMFESIMYGFLTAQKNMFSIDSEYIDNIHLESYNWFTELEGKESVKPVDPNGDYSDILPF